MGDPETKQYECPFGYVPDCQTEWQCISTLFIGDWICDSSVCTDGIEPEFPGQKFPDLTCYPGEKWAKMKKMGEPEKFAKRVCRKECISENPILKKDVFLKDVDGRRIPLLEYLFKRSKLRRHSSWTKNILGYGSIASDSDHDQNNDSGSASSAYSGSMIAFLATIGLFALVIVI
jgi:hypothetical protein